MRQQMEFQQGKLLERGNIQHIGETRKKISNASMKGNIPDIFFVNCSME